MKLDPARLLAQAKAATAFHDWGDDSFEERFALAIAHINSIPMDARGRQAATETIHWLLTDRLRFFEDRKLYPLADEVIDRPMFATGEPRSLRVEFIEPQDGVSPGQAAVFYRGDEVLGGAWITRALARGEEAAACA